MGNDEEEKMLKSLFQNIRGYNETIKSFSQTRNSKLQKIQMKLSKLENLMREDEEQGPGVSVTAQGHVNQENALAEGAEEESVHRDDSGKFDSNNAGRKWVKRPVESGMNPKRLKTTETPFSREKLSLHETSEMEEDFSDIVKTNIWPNSEPTTRISIDALVTSITQHNMLQFSVETPYKLQQEHTNTTTNPDYIIKDTNGPIGVVRIEPGKSLTNESVTQFMGQLIAIKQEIEDMDRNISLFGIMTDELHFIFIKLHPDGQFELQKDDRQELKVHRANTWEDLQEISEIFNGLCQLHKKFVSIDFLCEN